MKYYIFGNLLALSWLINPGLNLHAQVNHPGLPIAGMATKANQPDSSLFAGMLPLRSNEGSIPKLFSPSRGTTQLTSHPWKINIMTTVFWVGEQPTKRNPTPNTASSWDTKWMKSFGGYDNPKPTYRTGYLPKRFIPKENPFYIALPYNDLHKHGTKRSAKNAIPWFTESFYREGTTVLKGRWLAIRYNDKICYGQWEDCGPFETDNWQYVFGPNRPRTKGNNGAGLDVSPAIRDYLGFRYSAICDWRFVELDEVPTGPWKKWGNNNPFASRVPSKDAKTNRQLSLTLSRLHRIREGMTEDP